MTTQPASLSCVSRTSAPCEVPTTHPLLSEDASDCQLSFTGAAANTAIFDTTPLKRNAAAAADAAALEEGAEVVGDPNDTSVLSSHTDQDALLAFVNTNSPMPAKSNAFTYDISNTNNKVNSQQHHLHNDTNAMTTVNTSYSVSAWMNSAEVQKSQHRDPVVSGSPAGVGAAARGCGSDEDEGEEDRTSPALFSDNGESPSVSRQRSCTTATTALHMDHLLQRLIANSEQQFTAVTEEAGAIFQPHHYPQQHLQAQRALEQDGNACGGSNVFTPSNATMRDTGMWSSRPSEDRPSVSLERSPSPAAPPPPPAPATITPVTAAFTPSAGSRAAITATALPCFSTSPVPLFPPHTISATSNPHHIPVAASDFSTNSNSTPAAVTGNDVAAVATDHDDDDDAEAKWMWEQHAACMDSEEEDHDMEKNVMVDTKEQDSENSLLFLLRAMEAQEDSSERNTSHHNGQPLPPPPQRTPYGHTTAVAAGVPVPPLSAAAIFSGGNAGNQGSAPSEWSILAGDHTSSGPHHSHDATAAATAAATGLVSPPPPLFNPFLCDDDEVAGISREELERRRLDAFQRLQLANTGLVSPVSESGSPMAFGGTWGSPSSAGMMMMMDPANAIFADMPSSAFSTTGLSQMEEQQQQQHRIRQLQAARLSQALSMGGEAPNANASALFAHPSMYGASAGALSSPGHGAGRLPLSALSPNALSELAGFGLCGKSTATAAPRYTAEEEALLQSVRSHDVSRRDVSPLSHSTASSLLSPLSQTASITHAAPSVTAGINPQLPSQNNGSHHHLNNNSSSNNNNSSSTAGAGPANRNSFHAKLKAAAGSLIAVGGRRVPVDKLHHLISTDEDGHPTVTAEAGKVESGVDGTTTTSGQSLSTRASQALSPPPPDAMGCHAPSSRRAPGTAVKIIKATSSGSSQGRGSASPGNSPCSSSASGEQRYSHSQPMQQQRRRGGGQHSNNYNNNNSYTGGHRDELPPPPSVVLTSHAGAPSLRPGLSDVNDVSAVMSGVTNSNSHTTSSTTGPIVVLRFQRGEQMNFRVPKTSFVESSSKGRNGVGSMTAGVSTSMPNRYEVGKTYLAYIRGVCSPYGSFGYCDVGCCVRVYSSVADMMPSSSADAPSAAGPVIHGNLVRRIDPTPQSDDGVHQGELRHAEATVFQETLHRIQLLNIPVQLDSVHITHDGKVCVLYVHFFSSVGPQRDTAAKTLQKDVQRFVTYTVSVKSA